MHRRCSPAGRRGCSRRRDPGHHHRAGASLHRSGAGRGGHGLPVRARRPRLRAERQVGHRADDHARPQALAQPLARRARGGRLEQPLPGQPRPASMRQPVRQRRPRASRPVRQGAGDRAAPAPRHAVRLSRRRARPAQRRLLPARPAARHRVAELPRNSRRRGARARRGDPGAECEGPRQRAGADAVGRLTFRWLHDGIALDRGPPAGRGGQRRRPGRRPRLGLRALPAADRAAPRRTGRRSRHLPDAAARRPAGLCVRAGVPG